MKIQKLAALIILLIASQLLANGVAIIDASSGDYFQLSDVNVSVQVENQVATTVALQTFINTSNVTQKIKFGFPVPETASVTNLKWLINGQWYEAKLTATPQDTTLPGSGSSNNDITEGLKSYLGDTPLYFNIPHEVQSGDTLLIETTYVQMLSYKLGEVIYTYPNNYSAIQTTPLKEQRFDFTLNSQKAIESITCQSNQTIIESSNTGSVGHLVAMETNTRADDDFQVNYRLNSNEMGIFSLSTTLPDSVLPDPFGGFFMFVAEPDPSETTGAIQKQFTLIIDRSGSMLGNKITQAKNAATFIVNNLNSGDLFNIIDFESSIHQFKNQHIEYSSETKNQALTYINGIQAGGGTNISGAFDSAIPQFSNSDDNTANIIIFFTDGEATSGITDTDQINNRVRSSINEINKPISIFTFGIGNDANQRLLTLLANENGGFAEFLGNDDLESRITEFYLQVRNPVLINTQMQFSSNTIIETYPTMLPNLYKGQQLIVVGRYQESGSVNVKLSGDAFGSPVEYNYTLDLTVADIQRNQFLPKVWAKMKIEELLIQYYLLPEGSDEAEVKKQQIIEFSISYGIMSPFTSFTDYGETAAVDEDIIARSVPSPQEFELLGNYPNPFNPSTTIQFRIHSQYQGFIFLRIYNTLGQLVRTIKVKITSPGLYQVDWNGLNDSGHAMPSGTYIYVLDFGEQIQAKQMQLIK